LSIAEGRYTGGIDFYAYAENKAAAIGELAERRGYDLARSYAYSDSITDVHMLEAVGHPHVVNPDKELRKVARERGWPVLVFSRPVALGARMRFAERRGTMAALAAGTAIVVGGAIYLGARRQRLASG
jgi:phosphoserine phosphatase